MHPDFDNFDPDDNFAHSFSATPEDLDEDAALEAVAWQFLLLINPGDEDAALLQFNEAREGLASGTAPVDALRDAIAGMDIYRSRTDMLCAQSASFYRRLLSDGPSTISQQNNDTCGSLSHSSKRAAG